MLSIRVIYAIYGTPPAIRLATLCIKIDAFVGFVFNDIFHLPTKITTYRLGVPLQF